MHDDEVFVEDRPVFRGLDEPIELPAPASPGGVEDHENRSLAGGGLSFRAAQERRGGGRRLRGRESRAQNRTS